MGVTVGRASVAAPPSSRPYSRSVAAATAAVLSAWAACGPASAQMRIEEPPLALAPGSAGGEGALSRFAIGGALLAPSLGVVRDEPSAPRPRAAGVSGQLGGLSWDLGVASLPSPDLLPAPGGDRTVQQGQLSLGYAWGPLDLFAGGAYAPDAGADLGGVAYLEGGAAIEVPFSLTLGARVGFQSADGLAFRGGGGEAVDWTLGVSRDVLGFTMSLQYGGVESTDGVCAGGALTCDQRVYFSIDRRF